MAAPGDAGFEFPQMYSWPPFFTCVSSGYISSMCSERLPRSTCVPTGS